MKTDVNKLGSFRIGISTGKTVKIFDSLKALKEYISIVGNKKLIEL